MLPTNDSGLAKATVFVLIWFKRSHQVALASQRERKDR